MKFIPYNRQYIDNQDIRIVSKSLKQNLITTGNYVGWIKVRNTWGSTK